MVSLLIALQIWCLSKVRTRPAGRKVILGIFFGLTTEYRVTFPTILIEVARWLGSWFQGIIQMARWLVSRNGSLARQSIPKVYYSNGSLARQSIPKVYYSNGSLTRQSIPKVYYSKGSFARQSIPRCNIQTARELLSPFQGILFKWLNGSSARQ